MYPKRNTNIRAKRSPSSKLKGKLKAGQPVKADFLQDDWYAVFPVTQKQRDEKMARGYVYAPLLIDKREPNSSGSTASEEKSAKDAPLKKNITFKVAGDGNEKRKLKAEALRLEEERASSAKKNVPEEKRKKIAEERGRPAAEEQEKAKKSTTLAMAKRPSQTAVRETTKDGRFIAFMDETVLDTSTNLMWAAKDSGRDINWANARSYCENYRGGGYKDWRMPTQDELAGLYDKANTYRSACGDVNLTNLIRLTCSAPWASEARELGAANFDFGNGKRYWSLQLGDGNGRALPVRSGK